jgi:hypothetical protein
MEPKNTRTKHRDRQVDRILFLPDRHLLKPQSPIFAEPTPQNTPPEPRFAAAASISPLIFRQILKDKNSTTQKSVMPVTQPCDREYEPIEDPNCRKGYESIKDGPPRN